MVVTNVFNADAPYRFSITSYKAVHPWFSFHSIRKIVETYTHQFTTYEQFQFSDPLSRFEGQRHILQIRPKMQGKLGQRANAQKSSKFGLHGNSQQRFEPSIPENDWHSATILFPNRDNTTRGNPTVGGPLVGFLFEIPHFPRGYRVVPTSKLPTRNFTEWVNKLTFWWRKRTMMSKNCFFSCWYDSQLV